MSCLSYFTLCVLVCIRECVGVRVCVCVCVCVFAGDLLQLSEVVAEVLDAEFR